MNRFWVQQMQARKAEEEAEEMAEQRDGVDGEKGTAKETYKEKTDG
jgi:hypothetical protein